MAHSGTLCYLAAPHLPTYLPPGWPPLGPALTPAHCQVQTCPATRPFPAPLPRPPPDPGESRQGSDSDGLWVSFPSAGAERLEAGGTSASPVPATGHGTESVLGGGRIQKLVSTEGRI